MSEEELRKLYPIAKEFSYHTAYLLALQAEEDEEKHFYAFVGRMNILQKMERDAHKRQLLKEIGFTMRDINRIDPLIAKLGEAWKCQPDLRFGQFIVNFFSECQVDPFYLEEDVWMEALQAYIDGNSPKEAIDNHFAKN